MKFPWFPLYVQDFLSSIDVQSMNVTEIGAYFLLLINSWIQEEPCFLPNDDKKLKSITKLSDTQWDSYKSTILAKFKEKGDKLFNPKLLKIYQEKQEILKTKIEGGKKGAKIRWSSHKTDDRSPNGYPMAKHSYSESESEGEKEKDKKAKKGKEKEQEKKSGYNSLQQSQKTQHTQSSQSGKPLKHAILQKSFAFQKIYFTKTFSEVIKKFNLCDHNYLEKSLSIYWLSLAKFSYRQEKIASAAGHVWYKLCTMNIVQSSA